MKIREFTPEQYKSLLDFCIATEACRDLMISAHNLYHYRSDLHHHLLEFAFSDAEQALDRMNKAFEAVRPIFRPAEQEEAA